jgi:hypothetical protein
MRLFATLVILLFTCSLTAARAHHKNSGLVNICDPGDSRTAIFFEEPSEPNLTLAIVTRWYRYAYDLKSLLPAAGFELVTPIHNRRFIGGCHWKYLLGVSKGGIKRGIVASTYYEDAAAKGPRNAALGSEATGSEVSRVPSKETVRRVKAVLFNHAPTRDILDIVFIALSPVIAGAAFLLLLYGFYSLAVWTYPIKSDAIEEIEMASLRAPYPSPSITESLPPYPESVKDRYSVVSAPFVRSDNATVQVYEIPSIKGAGSCSTVESYC